MSRILRLLPFLLLALLTLACGTAPSSVVDTPPKEAPGVTVRVLSLNLHTYQEKEPLAKLRQVAEFARDRDVDVLLLQEVGEHISDKARPNAGAVIQSHLKELTGEEWHHEWAEAHIGFDVYHEGVSIVSRRALSDAEVVELSGGGLRRIALLATADIAGTPVRFVAAHITWPDGGGAKEVRRLLAHLDSAKDPRPATIIGGDFNAQARDEQVRSVVRAGFADLATATGCDFPTIGQPPHARIDYLVDRSGAQTVLIPLALSPALDGAANGPRVSDHIGLLGEYGIRRAD